MGCETRDEILSWTVWSTVAELADIPAGSGLRVQLGDVHIALYQSGGELFASEGACLRCGGDLASGILEGYQVECACCRWCYDIVTGCARGVPKLRLDVFSVRTSGAAVMVACTRSLTKTAERRDSPRRRTIRREKITG